MADLEETEVERRRATALENHAQTIISIIITGLVVWLGTTVTELSTNFASLNSTVQVEIRNLKEDNRELQVQVGALRNIVDAATRDRFTGQDASRVHGEIFERLKHHEDRLKELEKKRL